MNFIKGLLASCWFILGFVLFGISGLGHKQTQENTVGLKVANCNSPFRHLFGSPDLVELFIYRG